MKRLEVPACALLILLIAALAAKTSAAVTTAETRPAVASARADATSPRLERRAGSSSGYRFGLVEDIYPGPMGSSPSPGAWLDGSALFGATSQDVRELWTSDGTAAGTKRIETEAPLEHRVRDLVVRYRDRIYFRGWGDPDRSGNLWTSDGTSRGTRLFFSAFRRSRGEISNPMVAGDLLYFSSEDSSGETLWRTDGTPRGTIAIASGLDPAYRLIGAAGEELLYTESDSSFSTRLMSTRGRPGDARPIARSPIVNAFEFGRRLVFSGYRGGETRLFITDGTRTGTRVVRHPRSPAFCWNYCFGVEYGGSAFFNDAAPDGGGRVWKLSRDGDLSVLWGNDSPDAGVSRLLASRSGIAFITSDDERERLWTSTGSRTKTRSIEAAALRSDNTERVGFEAIAPIRDKWAVSVTDGSGERSSQLWVTDGTRGDSRLVAEAREPDAGIYLISHHAGTVLAQHSDDERGTELWALRSTSVR